MTESPLAIDLFAGAGGLSQGLADAGFEVLWGIDNDPKAVATYRHNHAGCAIQRNLQELSLEDGISVDPESDDIDPDSLADFEIEPGELDLIAGGPPCPTFSKMGRSKISSLDGTTPATDERHVLYEDFLRFVSYFEPRVFVMENVPGIVSATNDQGESVSKIILEQMESLGYSVDVTVVDAVNYGVPQKRQRAFFIGNRLGEENPDLHQWESHRKPLRDKEKQMKLSLDAVTETEQSQLTLGDFQSTLGDFGAETSTSGKGVDPEEGPKQPYRTVADAIFDLPPVSPKGEMPPKEATEYTLEPLTEYQKWARPNDEDDPVLHNHRCRGHNHYDLSLYKLLGEGVGWNIGDVDMSLQPYREDIFEDKYKKQNPTEPASTVVAHLAKDGHMFIHPREARSLTVREAARLQSFRDDFVFPVSRTHAFRLVGNAVPPLLGEAIGNAIRSSLLETES